MKCIFQENHVSWDKWFISDFVKTKILQGGNSKMQTLLEWFSNIYKDLLFQSIFMIEINISGRLRRIETMHCFNLWLGINTSYDIHIESDIYYVCHIYTYLYKCLKSVILGFIFKCEFLEIGLLKLQWFENVDFSSRIGKLNETYM